MKLTPMTSLFVLVCVTTVWASPLAAQTATGIGVAARELLQLLHCFHHPRIRLRFLSYRPQREFAPGSGNESISRAIDQIRRLVQPLRSFWQRVNPAARQRRIEVDAVSEHQLDCRLPACAAGSRPWL